MGAGEITFEDDPQLFVRVLGEAEQALAEAGIDHLVFGSISTKLYGAPEDVEDVDVLVRAQDAERALEALGAHGFDTDRTEPAWLFKGTKDGVLVDVIFQAAEKVHLDEEMLAHGRRGEFEGIELPLVSPEDAILIAALATKIEIPQHWWIALHMLAQLERMDWRYLAHRARLGPRKVLALLVFADAEDRGVPRDVVEELFALAYPRAEEPAISALGSGPGQPEPGRPGCS